MYSLYSICRRADEEYPPSEGDPTAQVGGLRRPRGRGTRRRGAQHRGANTGGGADTKENAK